MKKIIIILTILLSILLVILYFFSRFQGSKKIAIISVIPQQNQSDSFKPPSSIASLSISKTPAGKQLQNTDSKLFSTLSSKVPYETSDFSVRYDTEKARFVVEKHSDQAQERILDWARENNVISELTNPNSFEVNDTITSAYTNASSDELAEVEKQIVPPIFSTNSASPITPTVSASTSSSESLSSTIASNFSAYEQTLNLIVNLYNSTSVQITPFPFITPSVTPTPSVLPSGSVSPLPTSAYIAQPPTGQYVYYAQCSGAYDNYPLPNGCTICKMGCGLTTVAMVLSTFVDQSFTPAKVSDMYGEKKLPAGCNGSGYLSAMKALRDNGITITDPLIYSKATADKVVNDFRRYLGGGWTMFVLADFKTNGGGHFFWVTHVDEGGNIWAYDAYYGRKQTAPINENYYYPAPYYKVAFGVKK